MENERRHMVKKPQLTHADRARMFESARLAMVRHDHASAVDQMAKVCAMSNEPAHWMLLGDAHRACGDLGQAEVAYEEVIGLDPTRADARFARGAVRFAQGKFVEALEDLEQGVHSAGGAAREHERMLLVAKCREELGDLEEALVAYEGALRTSSVGDAASHAEMVRRLIASAQAGRPPRSALIRGDGAAVLHLVSFREFGYSRGPSLASLRDRRVSANRSAVAAYLRAGKAIVVTPGGLAQDVFAPSLKAGPMHILTDGRFAWHAALAHYVERYDVELPAEFEEHMQRAGFAVPAVVQTKGLRLPAEF